MSLVSPEKEATLPSSETDKNETKDLLTSQSRLHCGKNEGERQDLFRTLNKYPGTWPGTSLTCQKGDHKRRSGIPLGNALHFPLPR